MRTEHLQLNPGMSHEPNDNMVIEFHQNAG